MHEHFLLKNLEDDLVKKNVKCACKELRRWQFFEGALQHLELLFWAFKNGNGNINITVTRLALPVILKNLFNKNKTLIVWHYFDPKDGKKPGLKIYYRLLIFLLKFFGENKVGLIVVAEFWKNYFTIELGIKNVMLFPNFFEIKNYTSYKSDKKLNLVHLGQYSFKNDPEIYQLAKKLSKIGFECYFSTNDKTLVNKTEYYQIEYFEKFEDYLLKMSLSKYTLAMSFINEGWNRIAMESLLVGTQVIGYNKGGLGELLLGANALIAENADEVFQLIEAGESKPIYYPFLEKFDLANSPNFIQLISKFLIH